MDRYSCAVSGGKGGVGKTTATVNLGAAIADRGYDVVVVDADLRMANLSAVLGIDHETSIHDVLSEDAPVTDALVETPGGLTVLLGEQSLDAYAEADPANLPGVIETLREEFDVVLVDTGAGVSHDVAVALGRSDGILVLTTPSAAAVGDSRKTASLADRIDGTVLGTVVNRVRADMETDISAIEDEVPSPILGVVPEDVSATAEEPLVWHSPDSAAAEAFGGLADLLLAVWFDGKSPDAVDPVYEESWFVTDEPEEESDDAKTRDEDDGTDDPETRREDDEVFGMFN